MYGLGIIPSFASNHAQIFGGNTTGKRSEHPWGWEKIGSDSPTEIQTEMQAKILTKVGGKPSEIPRDGKTAEAGVLLASAANTNL